ncbi:hypothetical protein [Sphingomonas sp. CARO-RG-8B-R24-01]|uniref:hypothetical protein n=1 Tax=Sphingomonas sp. CARO-RG-8B-R24-01 TaxID=2914831 RepID=UPI001F5964A1|nr:hypothetical protein [Sphingomonas sp. CARO-RG-8B-R24-01]
MKTLYQSGYRPAFLPARFEATSIAILGEGQAAEVMRRKGAPEDIGDPVDAIAFFDDDTGKLVALVCDYANGRRAEYRRTRPGERMQFTTPTGDFA